MNWPLGSALAVVMLFIVLGVITASDKLERVGRLNLARRGAQPWPSTHRLRHLPPRRRAGAALGHQHVVACRVASCLRAWPFSIAPIVTLMVFSFNCQPDHQAAADRASPSTGTTRRSNNPDLMTALWNSVVVGLAAVCICLVIGMPTALALDRYDFPGKTAFRRLVILPITLPGADHRHLDADLVPHRSASTSAWGPSSSATARR